MTLIITLAKLNKKFDLKTNEKFRNNIKSKDNTKQFLVSKMQCQSLLIFDRQKYCTVSMQVRFVTKYLPKIQAKTTSGNE